MPWYVIGGIGLFVGAVIGMALGLVVGGWMKDSYIDDEKHGRQEWQQGIHDEWNNRKENEIPHSPD